MSPAHLPVVMDRRSFISGIALATLAAPLVADAQPAKKIPLIGHLSAASAEREKSFLAAFQQGLRELGYVEGQNSGARPSQGRYPPGDRSTSGPSRPEGYQQYPHRHV